MVDSYDPYAQGKKRKEKGRFKTPVEKLGFEDLWEDIKYCCKKIGQIKSFPQDYLGEKPDKYRKRFLELRLEIEKRIREGKNV